MTYSFQNEHGEIYYDEKLDAFVLKFYPETEDEHQFSEISKAFLEAVIRLKSTRLIVDARHMGILDYESQQWLAKDFFKQLKAASKGKTIVHAALLDSEKIMSRASIANVKQKVGENAEGFEFLEFTEIEELRKYFLSTKKAK